ncbi:hypothetical protein H9P43_002423 [Blastocladiella emersonii ATCC 22665]|nr:hypothetical protein H9P43_002423 [Blastocladiella emersonii ATCC 22665]
MQLDHLSSGYKLPASEVTTYKVASVANLALALICLLRSLFEGYQELGPRLAAAIEEARGADEPVATSQPLESDTLPRRTLTRKLSIAVRGQHHPSRRTSDLGSTAGSSSRRRNSSFLRTIRILLTAFHFTDIRWTLMAVLSAMTTAQAAVDVHHAHLSPTFPFVHMYPEHAMVTWVNYCITGSLGSFIALTRVSVVCLKRTRVRRLMWPITLACAAVLIPLNLVFGLESVLETQNNDTWAEYVVPTWLTEINIIQFATIIFFTSYSYWSAFAKTTPAPSSQVTSSRRALFSTSSVALDQQPSTASASFATILRPWRATSLAASVWRPGTIWRGKQEAKAMSLPPTPVSTTPAALRLNSNSPNSGAPMSPLSSSPREAYALSPAMDPGLSPPAPVPSPGPDSGDAVTVGVGSTVSDATSASSSSPVRAATPAATPAAAPLSPARRSKLLISVRRIYGLLALSYTVGWIGTVALLLFPKTMGSPATRSPFFGLLCCGAIFLESQFRTIVRAQARLTRAPARQADTHFDDATWRTRAESGSSSRNTLGATTGTAGKG